MANDAAHSGQAAALRIVSLQNLDGFSPWRDLAAGQYSIGGSLINDIALAGCDTAELFILTIEQTAFKRSQLSITALDSGLEIDGRELTIGEKLVLEPHMVAESASHRFEFSGGPLQADDAGEGSTVNNRVTLPVIGSRPSFNYLPSRNGKSLSENWQSRVKGASRLLAAAGFLLFAGFMSLGMRAFFQDTDTFSGDSVRSEKQNSNAVSLASLGALLFNLDLAQMLTIDEKAGKLRLSGELTEEQAARLKIALAPFGNKVLTSIRFKPNANHGVAGVFLKPREFVIATDGRLIGQGGLLKSGWRIETISRGGVLLSKNGQFLTAPVGDPELITGGIKSGKSAVGPWQLRDTFKAVK